MNESTGQLIECPNCVRTGKRQILGRVLNTGELLVLRFHHGTTLISTQPNPIILRCGCSYGFTISGTVVVQNIIPTVV
jgi:hypothetical protein